MIRKGTESNGRKHGKCQNLKAVIQKDITARHYDAVESLVPILEAAKLLCHYNSAEAPTSAGAGLLKCSL